MKNKIKKIIFSIIILLIMSVFSNPYICYKVRWQWMICWPCFAQLYGLCEEWFNGGYEYCWQDSYFRYCPQSNTICELTEVAAWGQCRPPDP